jgi:cysteine desulfurase/selenocysteine lyase
MSVMQAINSKDTFDLMLERQKFPILQRRVHGKALAYLDNAATTQKPQCVIDAMSDYYQHYNANVHRGLHLLSQEATEKVESVRDSVQHFLNAGYREEIIFTKGTTEAINLLAYGFTQAVLKPGDEVLISAMEHHSNIVPWQIACEQSGASLKVVDINQRGELDLEDLQKKLGTRTRLLAITHVSNALGSVNPIKEIIDMAHDAGVPVLVDGAQAVAHLDIDIKSLGCEFYAFSSHKLYGPCGVGVLYGKRDWLERLPPYQSGGDMIHSVSFEKTTYAPLPGKFEAGTPAIAEIIGLGAAIEYFLSVDSTRRQLHEAQLLDYCGKALSDIKGLRIIGTAQAKLGLHAFVIEGIHPHDIGTVLDTRGVAVRSGHHCAMPVMSFYQVPATVRASFSLYNNREDIDQFINALHMVREMLG